MKAKSILTVTAAIVHIWMVASVKAGPIVISHGLYGIHDGNILGIAYNPNADVIYLAHGSDTRGGYIRTIDLRGNLLSTWDFRAATGLDYATSLSYDASSGHLFAGTEKYEDAGGQRGLIEMSPDGSTIYGQVDLTHSDYGDGGLGLCVGRGSIWLSSYRNETITQLSMQGEFMRQFPVEGFAGDGGPVDLAADFDDGFFLLDHFGSRIVEVDNAGKCIAELSMWDTWSIRPLAIDSDLSTGRIFVNDDDYLYVFSGGDLSPFPPASVPLPSAALLEVFGLGVAWVKLRRHS